ncbi:MAG: hypothetical protein WDZ62_00195 [Candidatus Pacearchaeota archaeon]
MIKSKYPGGFDIIGNIAVVKFPDRTPKKKKKDFAERLMKRHKPVETVLEKTGKFKGRLRKQETKHVSGEKTKEVLYKENGCIFRFNVDDTYFSPRLSNERKEISKKIKRGDNVLVMFAGVAPFSIVIAKNSRAKKVYSNEINRKANEYAALNIERNKVQEKVFLLPGDIKKVTKKLEKEDKTFDVIVMPRPQLKDSFLRQAFTLSKEGRRKGTKIFYYDFCDEDKIEEIQEKIKMEAEKSGKKVKILDVKKAGEIAPYKFRIRVDFKVV